MFNVNVYGLIFNWRSLSSLPGKQSRVGTKLIVNVCLKNVSHNVLTSKNKMLYLKLYIYQDQNLGISTNILLHNSIENVYLHSYTVINVITKE